MTETHYVDKFHTFAHPELIYAKREGDGWDDGHPHERDEAGWCKNCGSPPGVRHARLVPRDTPSD